jgi:hypothetical protein
MKNLKNLKGAKMISKSEQQSIKGGFTIYCYFNQPCPDGYLCMWSADYGTCVKHL